MLMNNLLLCLVFLLTHVVPGFSAERYETDDGMQLRKKSCRNLEGRCVRRRKKCPDNLPFETNAGSPYCYKRNRCCHKASWLKAGSCKLKGEYYQSGMVFNKNCMKISCINGKWISSNQYNALCGQCSFNNDPHFTTFDGILFDWHGHSVYAISQEGDENCPNSFVASLFDECSSGYPCPTCVHTVYFQPDANTSITIVKSSSLSNSQIIIDGYTQHLTGIADGELLVLRGKKGHQHPAFAWMTDGCIHIMAFKAEGYLVKICSWGTKVFAYPTMKKNLNGLCGNWDDKKSNDLRFRNGTIMDPPSQIRTSFFERIVKPIFGNDWEVQECKGNGHILSSMTNLTTPACNIKTATTDEISVLKHRCEGLVNNGQDSIVGECIFDQWIATQNGNETLAQRWLGETTKCIYEERLEKNATLVYPPEDCSTQGGCDANATCILPHGTTSHICKCNVGWAGNGEKCGSDQDLDGFPDEELNCSDTHCRKDNCPTKPNSGQEDVNSNGVGDACDQTAPVITPTVLPPCTNSLTSNCNPDSDGDGIVNTLDNCPNVPNRNQANSDGDSFGDACDNCPKITNAGQEDKDQDLVGDVCDNGNDKDSDGIQDDVDNCPRVPNANQLNADDDDMGDACDDDADNDGVLNGKDNCWLVHNPSQASNDSCLDDNDNDNIENKKDNCPNNAMITSTDFRSFHKVDLDPIGTSQADPKWVIKNDGAEITQTYNSDPGLFFGNDVFGGVDFEGTFYIEDTSDDDYAGFVFSYQSNAKFYLMQWKKSEQQYWKSDPFIAIGKPAITLKKINSKTGPGSTLRNALWHTDSVIDQTELLWRDPNNVGWEPHIAYRWQLLHRPEIGLIRLRVLKRATLLADSGNIFDTDIKGGQLGAFVFSQEDVIWSNLGYRCNDKIPMDSYRNLTAHLRKKIEIDHSWSWW